VTDLTFAAQIDGDHIRCRISSDRDLAAPVFCFSLMAPPAVVAGGVMLRTDGGYGEVQLPDLVAGQSHEVTLAYANDGYRAVNRAWLPLGGYLRTGDETLPLPLLPAGVRPVTPAPAAPGDRLGLIPPPRSWAPARGHLEAASFATASPLIAAADALAVRCNLPPLRDAAGVPLRLTPDPSMTDGAYRIAIGPGDIAVTHGGAAGAHYAAISLLMLRAVHGAHLPCGTIDDAPAYGWRGQHLDCARHFYGLDTVLRLVDLMALVKMNRFHWHFSDDESFRLEVDCLPELWRQTALRGEGRLIPGLFGGGMCAGGHYSKADVARLVGHAGALFIEVLPEIEFPAHALGLVRVAPQTRDPNDHSGEVSVQGYGGNVMNPALPATWDLIVPLALEVAELFPFGMLHLGADELPPDTWSGSPAVAALRAGQPGLDGRDDVLGWALARLAARLGERGIRTAAWEEAARGANGGIGNGALLFSWTGQQAGIDAARAGYDIVMSPAQHVYLDMAHSSDPDDWGAAWAAFVGLDDTLNWSVVPVPDIADRIAGVEGTFWSEFTTQDHEIEPMLAPRILGVATKGWAGDAPVDIAGFRQDARAVCDIFTAMGWTWNAACFG